MTLSEATAKKALERIEEFHQYLNEGMDIESAKEIILESTCIKAVSKYIENYEAYNN